MARGKAKSKGKSRGSTRKTKPSKKVRRKTVAKRKSLKPSKGSTSIYYSAPPKSRGIKAYQRVRMPFCWSSNGKTIDCTDGGSGNIYYLHQFSLNSLFDPDQTGVGHQPRTYDEWSAFYKSYRVNGCKLELDISESTADSITAYIWASPSGGNVSMTTGAPEFSDATLRELVGGATISSSSTASWNKLQELSYVNMVRFDAGGTSTIKTFSHYYNVNKLMNIKQQDRSEMIGLMGNVGTGGSPLAEMFVNILIVKDDNTSVTNGFSMNARLQYWATLSEPQQINTS